MGKLRDLLDEAKRQRQAYEKETGPHPILGTIAEAANLLGSIPAAIEDNVREVPYGFSYGATMSPLGTLGDPAYMATEMLPMAWGRQPVDPVTYPGTTEYQAKTLFNLDPPKTFLGNLAYMAGGFTSPGFNDVTNLGKMALLLSPMRARKGNLEALAHARKMQSEGAALGDITRETYEKYGQGIEIDPVDNTAGFEISEVGPRGIQLRQTSVAALRRDKPDTLGKVIDWPELWDNHPEWQNVPVRIVPGEGGSYNKRFGYIELGEREWLKNPVNTIKTIIHENQHLVSDDAGWSIGGNPFMPELAPVIKERKAALEKKFAKEVEPLIDRRMALADAYGRDRSKWPKQAADEDARIETRLQATWNLRAEQMGAIPRQAYKDLRDEQRARLGEDRYGMTIEEMIQWPRSEFETEAARKNSIVLFDSKEPSNTGIQKLRIIPGTTINGKPRWGNNTPKDIEILENPTADEVARFAGREIESLRTMTDPKTKTTWVWNAEDGLHLDVADALLREGRGSEKLLHMALNHRGPEKTSYVLSVLRANEEARGRMFSEDMLDPPPRGWSTTLEKNPIKILTNPTPEETQRLIDSISADPFDKKKYIRGLVDRETGDKYIWASDDAFHDDVKWGLVRDKKINLSDEEVRYIEDEVSRRKQLYEADPNPRTPAEYYSDDALRYDAISNLRRWPRHEFGTVEELVNSGFIQPAQRQKAFKPRDEMFSEGRVTEFNSPSDEFDVKFRPVWGDENAIAKTRVLKNPTVEAIKALDAKKGELRALVDRRTGDVYVWDGYEAFHDDVLNSMVDMGIVGRHDARSLISQRDVTQSARNTIEPNEIEGGGMLRFGRLSGTLDVIGDRLNIKRQHKAPKARRGDEFGGKPAPILLGSQAKGLADTPEDFPRPQFPDLEEPRQLTRASVRNEGTKFAGAPAHVTSEAAEDAAVDSYLSRVLAGIPAMDWYLNVSRDLLKMSGNRLGVADHLAGSLGPTSAHTALAQNAQTGMRGYYQGVTGNPVRTATGLINSRIEELFQGMVEKYGPKINPYVHHLRGEWEPPPNRAVHDIWDRRAWGYSIDKAATEAEHRWMDLATAKAVKKANDTKLGGIDNWTPEKLQAAAWAVMKAEELGIPPGELAGGYLPEFDRLTGHFRIETNPGVKNPVSGLPEAGQDAYMRSVLNNLLTPEGQLAPLQQAGGITPPNQTTYIGAGDWEGTHSKVASTPFIGSLLGGEYTKNPNGNTKVLREGGLVLAPEFRELADSVAATVGMLLGQKGVGYDLAREANRIMDVNAVRGITGGRQLTGDDIQKMNDYLKSKGHEGTFVVPEDSNRGFKIVFSGADVKPGQRNLPKEETKSLLGQGQKILEDGKEAAKAAGLTVDEKLWVSSGNFVGDFDNYKPSKYMKSLQKGSKIRDRLNGKVQGAKGWAARQIQVMKSTGGEWDAVWMKTLETLRDGGFDAVDEAVKKKILPAAVVGILGYNLIEKEAKRDARSQDA